MIYHIYWGTAGNSGLYLDEIYQSLKKEGVEQKIFVSAYYPFDYGEKIFFPKSEMEHCRMRGRKRKLLQAWEFGLSLIKILKATIKDKPKVVNYSLISGSYPGILSFLKLVKRISGCKLVITCHDVKPFGKEGTKAYSREMANRKAILDFADYLLVHNENSITDLYSYFGIDKEKVVKHPFPVMDLSKLNKTIENNKTIDFLNIGQMRRDKGVHLLVEAWHEFHKIHPEARLCLAGNPLDNKFDVSELEKENVECHLHFISDEDYIKYVSSSRYVVLPYINGTNSGIISTVLSIGANVITSDIPMFVHNPLVDANNMFKTEDIEDLVLTMRKKYECSDEIPASEKLLAYRQQFNKEVIDVYRRVLAN